MIIARTRVWAPAVVASFTATRSFSIGLAICTVVGIWQTERAGAADWPLRGSLAPPTYVRWDGWQFGVEAGWGNFRSDFGNSTGPLVAFILRNTIQESEFAPSTWTTLPSNTTNGPVFGGYIGYNMQWDQLVLGVDLGYKYANIATGANDSISRQFVTSNQFLNTVSIDARAQMKLVDYATLRARAGYAWGQFLPYAMVGIAAGRFNYETTVTVNLDRHTNSTCSRLRFRYHRHRGQRQRQRHRRRRCGRPWHRLGSHARNVFARRMGIRCVRAGERKPFQLQYRKNRRRRALLGANARRFGLELGQKRPELTAAGKSPISASGTPLPNEGRLSGRIDK